MAGNRARNLREEIQEDVRKFGVLAAQIQLHVFVFQRELEEFLIDNQHPAKDRILSNFEEIEDQIEGIIELNQYFLNKQEQRTLMNSVEVAGIPEHFTRDLKGVVSILRILLRIRISNEYVKGFERVGVIRRQGKPRTLVIHLINRNIKKRILHVANYGEMYLPGSSRPISIKEHLTLMNHQLLRKARREAQRLQINNVWVDEGRIFVQRDENSHKYEIKCFHDIHLMHELIH